MPPGHRKDLLFTQTGVLSSGYFLYCCGSPTQVELPAQTSHKIFQTNSSTLIRDVWLTPGFVTRLITDVRLCLFLYWSSLGPFLYYRSPETPPSQNLLTPLGQLTLQVMTTTQLIPSDLLYRSISASQSPGAPLCLSLQLHQTDQIHFPAHSKFSFFCSLNSNSLPCRNQRSILTV